MIRVAFLVLFLSISGANGSTNVIYGGFSYGTVIPEETITKYVHDRSNGQSSIDKVLINKIKNLDNKSFTISYEALSDNLSEKDQNVLVLALDNETIRHISIPSDNLTRTDIILNFQTKMD